MILLPADNLHAVDVVLVGTNDPSDWRIDTVCVPARREHRNSHSVINNSFGIRDAHGRSVITHCKLADQCVQCDVLLSLYESATFELAKIHNQIDTAEHGQDRALTRQLTLQAYEVAERLRRARSTLARHRETDHNDVSRLALSVSDPSSNR